MNRANEKQKTKPGADDAYAASPKNARDPNEIGPKNAHQLDDVGPHQMGLPFRVAHVIFKSDRSMYESSTSAG